MSKQMERRNRAGQLLQDVWPQPLQSRNVLLHGHQRISLRLEPSIWKGMERIAQREGLSINDLCSQIYLHIAEQAKRRGVDPKDSGVTLTSAVRVFLFSYFQAAATEEGHKAAGHGRGEPLAGVPFAHRIDRDDDALPNTATDEE